MGVQTSHLQRSNCTELLQQNPMGPSTDPHMVDGFRLPSPRRTREKPPEAALQWHPSAKGGAGSCPSCIVSPATCSAPEKGSRDVGLDLTTCGPGGMSTP